MFTRRRSLDRRRKYTREFFESLIARLSEAGFDEIRIILPHNYASVGLEHSVVTVEEFLKRERNYAAVILRARAVEKDETLKILLINSNSKAVFVDDTFPSAESEPPALFFQSVDPARAYALFEYFHEYLSEASIRSFVALSVAGLAGVFFAALEILTFLGKHAGLLQHTAGIHYAWDIVAIIVVMIILFRFFAAPTGLWIKPKRELKPFLFARMALRGELRDNPIVQLIVTFIGGFLAYLFAKVLGLL